MVGAVVEQDIRIEDSRDQERPMKVSVEVRSTFPVESGFGTSEMHGRLMIVSLNQGTVSEIKCL